MKLKWTLPASQQLENIYHFYSQKSVEAAINIYNDIVDEVDILIGFPNIAAVEPLLIDCAYVYRSLIVRKLFKVVYKITDETIFIVAVFDCRQDPGKLISQKNRMLLNVDDEDILTEIKKEPQFCDSYHLVAETGLEPMTSRL